MNGYETEQDTESYPPVKELSKPQRRVLGVLIEKAYTVPESYPLTIKSLISGCNQKSNRSPITNYSEDNLIQTLDELRGMGLVASVHTESGRTERYRHYIRKRFALSEPQLAILTELLLRGRQQLGELRARASRMVPIESLQDLKKEVEGLLQQGLVQVDGPLDRRGVEIDHNFHLASENARMSVRAEVSSSARVPNEAEDLEEESNSTSSRSSGSFTTELESLRDSNDELRAELDSLKRQVEDLKEDLLQLRQSLGA